MCAARPSVSLLATRPTPVAISPSTSLDQALLHISYSWAVRTLATLIASLSVLFAPRHADAQIDLVEQIFGASNIERVTGHGRMAVGISEAGDLSVLTWPNPSFCDQLGYVTANGSAARSLPRFGASEGAGLFLGVVVDTPDLGRRVSWFRDDDWTRSQGYEADGSNIRTTYENDLLGLSVEVVDAVSPDTDVFVRDVIVSLGDASPVTDAWLLTYANLSPVPPTSRLAELPLSDWAFDGRNDFAAVWDASRSSVVHFHPGDRRVIRQLGDILGGGAVDWGTLGEAMRAGTPDDSALASLAADLDGQYAAGAYLALTTRPPPDQHQVGFDASDLCADVDGLIDNILRLSSSVESFNLPVSVDVLDSLRCDREAPPIPEAEGWIHEAADALEDARDGELSGSGLAAGEVNEALRTPLAFDAGGVARVSLMLAAAPSADEVGALVDGTDDPSAVADASRAAFDAWMSSVRVPTVGSELVQRVARRALINVRVGTDASSGAIVASISRQAPYGLDWPRDGAFFNVMLDASGQNALVTRRAELYDTWQRKVPVSPAVIIDPQPPDSPDGPSGAYPAGAWEMNYYADGLPGGTWRFEIDEVGFGLFAMISHVGWVAPAGAADYLRARWDAIVLAADLLTDWRDPETGLHFPAQEDDNADYTQTLHGAVTVFGGLDMASRAARLLGEEEAAARWEERAAELRDAILVHFYDVDREVFTSEAVNVANPGSSPSGPTAWLVWPMHVLPWDDPRVDAQLRHDLENIGPTVRLENAGGSYWMKNLVSLALARGDDPEIRAQVEALLERTAEHATPGGHFGEVTVAVGTGSMRHGEQRVSNPHLWEGTLFYLTALALEDPQALLAYEDVLPASRVPAPFTRPAPPFEMPSESCDAARISPLDPAIAASLALVLFWARRRRR